VILQSLRRDPRSRFHSAAAMSRAIEVVSVDGSGTHDDETRVVRTQPSEPRAARPGYVPPPVPRDVQPRREPARQAPPRRAEPRRPARRRSSTNLWGVIGTLLVLAAAGLVIVLIVLPLLDLGGGDGSADATPTSTPAASQIIQPNVIPETVGRSTQEAIEIARAAGLDWTVRCNEDASQPEGIIGQEPPAGTEVAPGSAFTMFSARIADCR
jgi:hypothetical protein